MQQQIKTMRKTAAALLFGLFFMAAVPAHSQTYYVYSLRETVKLIDGKNSTAIKLRQKLTEGQTLKIGNNGMVILFDRMGKRLYTINVPGTGKIKDLIARRTSSLKDLSVRYAEHIWKQISGKGSLMTETAYMGGITASYRDADSTLMMVDSLQAVQPDTTAVYDER